MNKFKRAFLLITLAIGLIADNAAEAADVHKTESNSGATGSSCTPYHLGDTGPDGGKVFYIDVSNCHGLEAKTNDASSGQTMTWAKAITTSASYNTTPITIALSCSTTNAQLTPNCWHLPSESELNYLCEQKAVVGSFANLDYWSSSELDANNAWGQDFDDGTQDLDSNCTQDADSKSSAELVRAVRAF
jgi:uncharacterized protein (TIGR02145 family)